MFGNIEDIAALSTDLCGQLERVNDNDEEVGLVFNRTAAQLRDVYGTYCRNHDSASQILLKVIQYFIQKLRITL